jgi:hypothetical protein
MGNGGAVIWGVEPRSGSIFLAVGFNPRNREQNQKEYRQTRFFSCSSNGGAREKDTETIRREPKKTFILLRHVL